MADDNSPTGGYSYPGSAGDPFKDLFGGNPTMGANPTQGPVTSNSAPSSGSSGTSSSTSSDGGGVGSDAGSTSSGADSIDSGASSSTSQSTSTSSSSPPSNAGISSSAGASTTDTADPMGREGGGSYADDMSITGGGAPDGRTSYSDPASGGLSDQGPIGGISGISGIDGSQQAPVSLSSQATSVPSGVDDFAALRSALGIGGQPFPGATGTNFGTAMSDPTAATPAASWAGLDAPPADSIVNMGSPYNNPFRSPVGTLSDNLPPSITAPKTQDRVPQTPGYGDSIYSDAALNDITPTFDGSPLPSSIPQTAGYNPLDSISPPIAQPFNNSVVAQTGFPSGTQSAWGGGPPSTNVAQNDIGMPGSEIQLGGYNPLSSVQAPQPQTSVASGYDPLSSLKAVFGISSPTPSPVATNAGRFPSRGSYGIDPYTGQPKSPSGFGDFVAADATLGASVYGPHEMTLPNQFRTSLGAYERWHDEQLARSLNGWEDPAAPAPQVAESYDPLSSLNAGASTPATQPNPPSVDMASYPSRGDYGVDPYTGGPRTPSATSDFLMASRSLGASVYGPHEMTLPNEFRTSFGAYDAWDTEQTARMLNGWEDPTPAQATPDAQLPTSYSDDWWSKTVTGQTLAALLGIGQTGSPSLPQAPRVGLPAGSFPATTAQPEAQNSAPPMQGPSNDIPQPEDPLAALRNAFGVKTATQVYPSRGNYQGYPAAAQSILRATQTGPQSSEMTQNVAPDPNFSVIPASAPPFRQGQNPDLPPGYEERYFPNGIEIPGTVENVPPEATPQRKTNNIQVTTAAPPMDPGVTDVPELPQPGDPYETASTENAPVPGTSENPIQTNQIEAPSQNDPPPTTTGSILGGIVDALTRGRMGDRARNDYNDYADMSPEQKQAWQERRDAEQRVADSRDGGGARGEAEQNRKTTTDEQIDELNLQIAELQAELARRRAASQRSAAQYGLIMRNYT